MPKEIFVAKKIVKNCKIGLLATEATIKTKIYHNYLTRNFELVTPTKIFKVLIEQFNSKVR